MKAGSYGPEDVSYIVTSKLHLHVDRLLGAILAVKPDDAAKYFYNVHKQLQQEYPSKYASWLVKCPDERQLYSAPRPTTVKSVPRIPERTSTVEPRVNLLTLDPTFRKSDVPCQRGQDCILYNATAMDVRLQDIISEAANFDRSYSAGPGQKKYSLQNEVHWKLRLAWLFLQKIGRDIRISDMVKSAKGHYEYANQDVKESYQLPGLPNVKLINELTHTDKSIEVVVSASHLQEECKRVYGEKEVEHLLSQWCGWKNPDDGGEKATEGLGLRSCSEIYGDGVFRIPISEVCELEQKIKIYTGASLPPRFFLRLVGITSRDSLIEYYYNRKAIPLAWMGSTDANGTVCEVGKLVLELSKSDEERKYYGFQSQEHFIHTIQQSLTELSTQVCIAGPGYFFGGNFNQIQPKSEYPILFLSAPGIDFNAGAASRSELSKYFLSEEFKPGGRAGLKKRVKQTYHILFTACKDNGVTHPTAIAMGLGIFLPPIAKEEVKTIYHEAQFELLQENDYGFDTYFLNPGPGKTSALCLLDNEDYKFKCRVMIHFKDGKALASQLAHRGYRTSFLNPSDCIAVMQGCIGYWWERGLGERYVGEEDFCATSTAILARSNICRIWSAYDHGRTEEEMTRVIQVIHEDDLQLDVDPSIDICDSDSPSLDAYWPPYPLPIPEVDNPAGEGFTYEWLPKHLDSTERLPMKFFRILWVDSLKHHELHLRPMINRMRREGIVVDVAHGTERALQILKSQSSDIPFNFVLTSLFVQMQDSGADDVVAEVVDSGHKLLKEINQCDCLQRYYFRTVCASMAAINSHERSCLYSEGCNLVKFNLHNLQFEEVMNALCFVQRHSDRLCAAICSNTLGPAEKVNVVSRLIQFGVDVNFPPKAWAPLHMAAKYKAVPIEVMALLLQAKANVEVGTRYTTSGIECDSTPLHVALRYDNQAAVKLLLDHGANPYTKGVNCSKTPFDVIELKRCHSPEYALVYERITSDAKEKYPETHAERPLWHSMLTVLWISTSQEVSHKTQQIRRMIDSTPALVVQTLQCAVEEDALDDWISGTLHCFMDDVGTDETADREEHREPLIWLQCVVLELTDQKRLKVWLRIIEAIKSWVKKCRPDGKATWLKIITYAEGFSAKEFEGPLANEPYLSTESAAQDEKRVMLNTAERHAEGIRREIICESGDVTSNSCIDPKSPNCSPQFKRFYRELCTAVTHWTVDMDDRHPLHPDFPYSAPMSAKIEEAYRNGAPSCWVSLHHKIYFRDMCQRVVSDPMRIRLVFRYPDPCFDCDEKVRSFPAMLKEIASGRCLIFIGAGFCVPAGGPSWAELLKEIAAKGVAEQEETNMDVNSGRKLSDRSASEMGASPLRRHMDMKDVQNEVDRLLLKGGDHTQFELAAQLLEDALEGKMQSHLAAILKDKVMRGREILDLRKQIYDNADGSSKEMPGTLEVMASRINYVQCLKFSSVLTTNYSQELCVCEEPFKGDPGTGCGICRGPAPLSTREPAYLDIIRTMPAEIVPLQKRPMIPIHGSVSQDETIVLSREGYRSLLHGKPNYRDFLKSTMMSRTILYLGFSFTDDYLNEVRSDVMSMKQFSPQTKNLAYAIINDKSRSHCQYYDQHEGVKILTWSTAAHGFGMMDRYLDSILNMTDTSAALSGAKVVIFTPPDDNSQVGGSSNQNAMKLQVELQKELQNSQVFKVMPPDFYQEFKVVHAETLSEVERALKTEDFLQSWVVTFADDSWNSIPMTHRELINFLWHPHARLLTTVYPPTLLVWGSQGHLPDAPQCSGVVPEGHPRSLKEQYESNLHVRFCVDLDEVLATFRRVHIGDVA